MNIKSFYFTVLIFLASFPAMSQTPAFPTAEGYGKYAKGGRGGKVVFVENLDDYIAYNNIEAPIPGSFRWALTQYPGEPLTVIFRVSGVIKLKPYLQISGSTVKSMNDIRCSRANLTIAGQSAPGEGIVIRNAKVNLGGCTDLVVRNVRFRIGDAADPTPIYGYKVGGVARDTLAPAGSFLPGGSMGCENAVNVIFDHCVFGWSGEENATMYDNRFTTMQWCMLHEALYDDGHGKGARSYGGQLGGINATYHHNLLAHNQSRSPRLNGARTENEVRVFIEFINNVNYNWGSSAAPYGADINLGTVRSHTTNFVGNYYKPGPATSTTRNFFRNYIVSGANYPKWYLSGNYMYGKPTATADNWSAFEFSWSGTAGTTLPTKLDVASDTLLYPPATVVYNGVWVGYTPYRLNIESAEVAYQNVLEKVGTINRDSVERRVVNELVNGSATFIASLGKLGIIDKSYDTEGYLAYKPATPPVDDDRDGMADDWELSKGLNPADAEDRNWLTSEGYTALEVYLNGLMGEVINPVFFSGTVNVNSGQAKIYPVVVDNFINIASDQSLKNIDFFNTSGAKIKSVNINNNRVLNVSDLKAGHYIVKVSELNGNTDIFKIIKK